MLLANTEPVLSERVEPVSAVTVEKSCELEIYPPVARPVNVLPSFESNPSVDVKPIVPRPTIDDVSSCGSIIEDTYVLTPITVEFKMAVRPIAETKPTVPRPRIEDVSSTGSIMLEILLVMPSMEDSSWLDEIYPNVARPIKLLLMSPATRGIAPLMLDTMTCGVQTVPDAVKMPVLIWRVECDVVIISPMLMKPLLEPIARESTTRELIYPWTEFTF